MLKLVAPPVLSGIPTSTLAQVQQLVLGTYTSWHCFLLTRTVSTTLRLT